MPIWKRKGIKKTGKKCDACKLKGLDVDLQLKKINENNIEYIYEKIDVENQKLKDLIMIGISWDAYNFYQCYVCGWFKLVKIK